MSEKVDARNMPCPEPVVRTKKALDKITEGKITVLVNSPEANQNVQRFVKSQQCSCQVSEKDGEFTLEITKEAQIQCQCGRGDAGILLVGSDRFGSGDEELGQILITAFINTLPEAQDRPSKILFINRGVMLTTEGSNVLDTLQTLEKEGVEIFSCGTCLNHYELKEKLQVGKVTNMYDTVDSLLAAEKVVRI